MKALTYDGPGRVLWTDVPLPRLQDPRDAVVRVDATTICGTDLHILKGDVPEVERGRILGHEAVGTVLELGSAVTGLAEGDRVLVSCICGCGRCSPCRRGAYGQCTAGGGWVLGHLIDGTQAEYVRVPFADLALHPVPETVTDQDALMLSDIVPTGYEVGVLNGHVSPGDTVAVVGAGPVGLAAMMTAKLFSPARVIAIDLDPGRLEAAKLFGADHTVLADHDPGAAVAALTGGRGADVVVEAVGVPESFELATRLVSPGGRVANVGVHGRPVTLHLEDLWIKNVTITTGLVDTSSTPTLLAMLATGQLVTRNLVTHHFPLAEMLDAYRMFGEAASSGALKIVLVRA
jgi:alcohol dehydrogenase